MAPSRRKGFNKAAAAAAARRKWKVGDLVLAKVKGFPAWPATVSEPEKWGYSADWKKVVVHFFGTEQIAFCNPADVEEFTEEKKASLLGRRHGKGADFVRAVNEIIDCFEKLKELDQVSKVNETEGTNISKENIDESLTASVDDDAVVTAKQLCAGATNDLNSLTEAAIAAAAEDALHEMQFNEESSNLLSTETPVSTTYLTINHSDFPQRSGSRRRKSARVLRSSSRVPQSTLVPSAINTRSSRLTRASVSEDRSLRRSRRIVKSSDDSVGEDVDDSLAFVLSNSSGGSDSETMTVHSDSLSINYVGIGDSDCKPVGVEQPFPENHEGETELTDRLDFQSNNAVIKKKRRPNRKRHSNDSVEAAKHDLVASAVGMQQNECVSPTLSDKSAQKYVKDDGDEHLPLVKRARVRKGMPSPMEEVTLAHEEEKMFEAPGSLVIQSFELLSCHLDHADTGSVSIREDPVLSSLSHASPVKKHIMSETRKNHVDGEAALPPSKRLHRALEAMSANVAEDYERAPNSSPASNIQSNGYCHSFSECSEQSMGNRAKVELESESTDNLRSGDCLLNASDFCITSDAVSPKNDSKSENVIPKCDKTSDVESTDPSLCGGSFECVEGSDTKRLKLSTLNDVPAETDADLHVKLDSLNASEQSAHLICNTAGMTISSADHCKTVCSDMTQVAEKSDPDISQMNSNSKCVEETAGVSPNNDTRVQLDADEVVTNKKKHLLLPENIKRPEFVEETCSASLGSNIMFPEDTPMKVLSSSHHHSILNSGSIPCDHVEDRTISITYSSSSLTDGIDGSRASPPNSSFHNLTALESKSSLENNYSSSPDVQLHLEKAKLAGKSTSKRESLSSFEAVIKSLTRTKESIGRATRIAIDCAKLGFATKVVEILAQNLEGESSLHRKVDLFFLVDSITQCSRGFKGDGGVYPSAIQALLPRLLLAAAPPGSSSHENHRQCLKVLRVWQERKILPEPIIRHHIRELDALCGTAATTSYPNVGSQRPLRNERAFDDPIREMEGMQVDEYGSNSSIQLLGFCMPPMLKDVDGGSDSDGEGFEAVTPEHNNEDHDGEKTLVPAVEKRSHILEDVDGELEMEDVAPCCEGEIDSTSNTNGADHPISNYPSDNYYGAPSAPQQSKDVAVTSSILSSTLPPPLPPPPPPPPHHTPAESAFSHGLCDSVPNGPDSKPYSSLQANRANQTVLLRVKQTATDPVHHRVREHRDYESHMHRQMQDSSSACSYSDRPTSQFSGRASYSSQRADSFSKGGFHLRPPHPAPSNQFSYVHDQRIQSRRDFAPLSHSNRYHARNTENGNFYKDRSRNKFIPHDNIGECWRPPFTSVSGPYYPDDARMGRSPMSFSGPPREPPYPNSRWDFPPRPMNHRHFNYRPSSEGPVHEANRGPFWRPR